MGEYARFAGHRARINEARGKKMAKQIIQTTYKCMMEGIKKGWFPPLPKVRNSRSMIHVDDLVQALLLVSNDIRANGEIFIASDGKSYSSRDLYEAMCYALGKSIPKWNIPIFLFEHIFRQVGFGD